MTGQFPKRSTPRTSSRSEVSPVLFQHRRFWLKIAAYRPLLILGVLWVVLLLIGMAAYDNLMHTVKDMPEVVATDLEDYPHQRGQDDAAAPAPVETADTSLMPAGEAEAISQAVSAPDGSTVSPWSMGALVVTCALGCLMVSRQLQTPPRPRRKPQKRGLVHPQPAPTTRVRSSAPTTAPAKSSPVKSAKAAPEPTRPQRLDPYDPAQPFGVPVASQGSVLSSEPVTPTPPAAPPADVTVLPEDTVHPLDWPEDSLVNSVDMRRQRSLSSFL